MPSRWIRQTYITERWNQYKCCQSAAIFPLSNYVALNFPTTSPCSQLSLLLPRFGPARLSNRPSFPLDPLNIFDWGYSVEDILFNTFVPYLFSLLSFFSLARSSGVYKYSFLPVFPSLVSFLLHLLFFRAIPHVLLFYFLLMFPSFPFPCFHFICSLFSVTLPPSLFSLTYFPFFRHPLYILVCHFYSFSSFLFSYFIISSSITLGLFW